MCCTRLTGNTGRKKSPFWHHRTTLSGYIFRTKACIDNRKNLLNSYTSSTCPDNIVKGLLTAEIRWRVWDTPANFNRFHVLAALLHGTLVVGVSQTLRCETEGATYIWQGGHHVGHWPIFLVVLTHINTEMMLFPYLHDCCLVSVRHCLYFKCSFSRESELSVSPRFLTCSGTEPLALSGAVFSGPDVFLSLATQQCQSMNESRCTDYDLGTSLYPFFIHY